MKRVRRRDLKYRLEVHWSAEDRCYVVNVPELEGCMTHAGTIPEAVSRAEDAIRAYLESLQARGLPVPPPLSEKRFSGKIPLRIDPTLHRDLTIKARILGVSLNRYIDTVLQRVSRD